MRERISHAKYQVFKCLVLASALQATSCFTSGQRTRYLDGRSLPIHNLYALKKYNPRSICELINGIGADSVQKLEAQPNIAQDPLLMAQRRILEFCDRRVYPSTFFPIIDGTDDADKWQLYVPFSMSVNDVNSRFKGILPYRHSVINKSFFESWDIADCSSKETEEAQRNFLQSVGLAQNKTIVSEFRVYPLIHFNHIQVFRSQGQGGGYYLSELLERSEEQEEWKSALGDVILGIDYTLEGCGGFAVQEDSGAVPGIASVDIDFAANDGFIDMDPFRIQSILFEHPVENYFLSERSRKKKHMNEDVWFILSHDVRLKIIKRNSKGERVDAHQIPARAKILLTFNLKDFNSKEKTGSLGFGPIVLLAERSNQSIRGPSEYCAIAAGAPQKKKLSSAPPSDGRRSLDSLYDCVNDIRSRNTPTKPSAPSGTNRQSGMPGMNNPKNKGSHAKSVTGQGGR